MALNLYRRHRQECEAGHPEESRSGEFEERKKGWKRCACFIFASGTINRKFGRKYTGKSDWDDARAVAAVWEETQSWDGKAQPEPEPVITHGPARITIADAVKVFLSNREGAKIAPARCESTGPSPSSSWYLRSRAATRCSTSSPPPTSTFFTVASV